LKINGINCGLPQGMCTHNSKYAFSTTEHNKVAQ
jgi:hypothetical protein